VTRSDTRVSRLPWAIGVQNSGDVRRGQATLGVDEALNNVPGVMVSNRYNYSLDARMSVRGAGSRANFGTRGVKVLLDGVPQSLPDGQSQLTNVELGTIGRIEVLRGAASSLYGNGSGGVISFETDMRARDRLQQSVRETFGSYGMNKWQLRTVGRTDKAIGALSVSRTTLDGFRRYCAAGCTDTGASYSGADARQVNGAIDYALGSQSTLQIRANVAGVPFAQNPGALTKAEWDVNPDSVASANIARGAFRAIEQHQYSVGWRHTGDNGNALRAVAYYLTRLVENPLATAPPAPAGAANGTYSELRRRFFGARLDAQRTLGDAARAPRFSAGVDLQRSRDFRKNWRSTGGKHALATDTLLVDQTEIVTSIGPFASLSWMPTDALQTNVGLRWDRQSFSVDDHFLGDGDDDSGDRPMSAWSGHLGGSYAARAWLSPYANIANAFETPTTTELNARSDGTGGFNADLGPQRITTVELGARGARGRVSYDVSAFSSRTTNAIIQFTEVAGRAFFRNAGRTRSTGLEVGVHAALTKWLDAQIAFTQAHYVFAEYRAARVGGVDTLDNHRLAGVPERFVRAGLRTRRAGLTFDADWTWSDRLWADDANTLKIDNWGKGRLDARLAWSGTVGGQRVAPFVAVNNWFNQRYVGAITLNGAFGRVREAAPRRNFYAGLEVNWSVLR
jgi:iron complex outermembrane receptor protein